MLPAFTWLSYIMAFSFGAAIGSFLGAVIERSKVEGSHPSKHNKDAILDISGRSRCGSCKRQLKWWENVPIVSFFFLKGKCRTCRSPIPYWLPLIEIAGGLAGVWLASWASQTISVITFITIIKIIAAALIAAALIWVFFSDLVFGTVPDAAILIGSVGAVIYRLPLTVYGLLWPAVSAAGFFLFLVLVTRGRGMGTGDVTLAAFLGLWLGWPRILLAMWLAFLIGAIWGAGLILLGRKKFGQTIPFGPFMIAGSIIAEIWGLTLLQLFLTI